MRTLTEELRAEGPLWSLRKQAANSIEMLEGRVEWLGEIANVCVYEEIRRACSYCQCKRKSDK